jgi:TIR domain-containing protein
MTGPAPKVFLSYRRKETELHAGWLYDALEVEFGKGHVFIDADIRGAENFVQRIAEVLRECESMVVVIGPRWATIEGKHGRPRLFESRDFVRSEVETALRRQDVQVLPVLVGGAEMPAPEELPESLRTLPDLNAIDVSDNLRRRRDDIRHLIATLRGRPKARPKPSLIRPLLEGVATAAAAGVAGGVLGGLIEKTGTDDVTRILSNVTQRALTWAVVGAALAVWLTILRGESRGGLGRGLFGLIVGALAGALGGAVFGAAVNLPEEAVTLETREQIQIGALAVTGGGIGALLGRLWIPARAGPGLVAGAAGGAFAQIVLNAGDWGLSSALAVGFRSVMTVSFVITTTFALDALHTTATASTDVRPAV